MEKEEYIKAIEDLNKEQIQFYNSPEYKKYRDKIIRKQLIKNKEYKKVIKMKIKLLKNKTNEKNIENKDYKIIKNNIDITNKRKIVYTCILGDYDNIYSPLIITDNTEYIIFSDNPKIVDGISVWKYREIPKNIKELFHNDYTLINRYIKMHPKELFPDKDYALYIDGSIRIISDIDELFCRINNNTGLAMHIHPKREDVYQEAKACIESKFGKKEKIKKQIKKYKEENFPEKYGLFEAIVIAIDIKNNNSEKILNNWWEEFYNSETYRDQLIFTYVLWKNNYKFEDVGILGQNILTNPKFRKYMHKMKRKEKFKSKLKKLYKKNIRPLYLEIINFNKKKN